MSTTLGQLHSLLDNVNPKEYDILFHLLMKFIPEDTPLPDEIAAIQKMDDAINHNQLYDGSAIDWN